MKSIIYFAARMMTVRMSVILLSLAQTTMWASVLGLQSFGLVATYLSAQAFASLLGRFGTDNLLVRHYDSSPTFFAKFPGYFISVVAISTAFGAVVLFFLTFVVFGAWQGIESGLFLLLVVAFNLSTVLSRILVAQKRLTLASILANAIPPAVSLGLFALTATRLNEMPISGHIIALSFLSIGYLISALAMIFPLRKFFERCIAEMQQNPQGIQLLFGRERWHFLAYQSMGMARSQGATLAVAALFGPAVTGIFALANRFGSLLSYLNEPARMFVMPRVAGKTHAQLGRLYRTMLGLNAALGLVGIAVLAGLYRFVTLPIPTDPPFLLYTLVIMIGAAFNLFVGPVGAILAMSGNEWNNLVANLCGLSAMVIAILLAAVLEEPLIAVVGVAASSIVTNLMNTVSFISLLRSVKS